MKVKSVKELIGNTPLVELQTIEKAYGLKAKLYAKVEYYNPAGSVKDRVAAEMIDALRREGKLTSSTVVIEPTSGNTGIGLALICALEGLRAVIVMPDSMSSERIKLMRAYGAEVVLTPGAEGMKGAIAKAQELQRTTPNSIIAGQFENPANPEAHYKTTARELWKDLDGKMDVFVAGVGTGGTVTGVARFWKERNPQVRIIGVEPKSSAVLSGGTPSKHKIQGIGAGFVPQVLQRDLLDEILPVSDEDAFRFARELPRSEGLLAGISSGAALATAVEVAKRPENEGKNVVVLLPDTGMRYLSGDLFA